MDYVELVDTKPPKIQNSNLYSLFLYLYQIVFKSDMHFSVFEDILIRGQYLQSECARDELQSLANGT